MAIHLLWVDWEDVTLQIIGLGYERFGEELGGSIKSLRPLTEKEMNSFSQTVLRIIEAKEGESVADACKRVDCPVKSEVIALFNGLELNEPLKAGQLLKVGVKEPYSPKR